MTVCNMTIEGGGRAGHDRARRDDLRVGRSERTAAPIDPASLARRCAPTTARRFDTEIVVDAAALSPMVTWGTNPEMVVGVADAVPEPAGRRRRARAGSTWASRPGTPIQEIKLDRVFIGSCTNSRIGDLRAAAEVVKGRKVADDVYAMVVPGSEQVQAAGRERGPGRGLPGRRLRLARRRLLDVPGHEPGHPAAGRALRLDLEPQLRGPPGPRRPHAPRLARRWPPRPRSRATSSTSGSWELTMEADRRSITGPVSVLDRDDVDTDQIIPKQFLKRVERTGFGEFLFYDWAKEPGWDLPHEPDPRRGPQLRLRLEPRARAVGAGGLRLPGDHRPELRRHLPLQLHEDRAAAGRARRGRRARRSAEPARRRSTSPPRRSRWPGGTARFEIDPEIKHRLLNGLDDIGLTLQQGRRDRRLRARPRAHRAR